MAALALHVILVGLGVVHHSVTNDELGHLPAGIAYLQHGGFDVNPQPPAVKLLGAATALAAGARPDYAHAWREAKRLGASVHYPDLARDFMRANAEPPGHYHRLLIAARLVVLPFSLLLGAVLFAWGRDLFGEWGGLLALSLTYGTFWVVFRYLFSVAWIPAEWAVLGLFSGTVFGVFATGLAVRKHLREV